MRSLFFDAFVVAVGCFLFLAWVIGSIGFVLGRWLGT